VVLHYHRGARQRSSHVRQRRAGRQRTLVHIIRQAPDRASARARVRGVVAHHLDRAETRWRFGTHRPSDAAGAVRSMTLAASFAAAGPALWWSRSRR
jgi:hypothetical protein